MYCYIGIDPAFRKNGFAVCIIDEDNTADFKIFENFYAFISWLWDAPLKAYVCIENSNLQDSNFNVKKTDTKELAAKKGRDVGKNMAISQATVDFCRKHFGEAFVVELSPKEKGAKIEDLKIFEAIVRRDNIKLINYKGQVGEQDKRDAYMLARKVKFK
jgi:hypothetical protein